MCLHFRLSNETKGFTCIFDRRLLSAGLLNPAHREAQRDEAVPEFCWSRTVVWVDWRGSMCCIHMGTVKQKQRECRKLNDCIPVLTSSLFCCIPTGLFLNAPYFFAFFYTSTSKIWSWRTAAFSYCSCIHQDQTPQSGCLIPFWVRHGVKIEPLWIVQENMCCNRSHIW